MIAVPEALFEGPNIGLDPRAGWVLVRLLSMARGGRVALPTGRPVVDSLALVAGIERDCLIAGIELLSALRLIRVTDGEISIEVVEPMVASARSQDDSPQVVPDSEPPRGSVAKSDAERARAYRARRRDGVTESVTRHVTERDGERDGVTASVTASVTGGVTHSPSRGGSRDSDSPSSSSLLRISEKKEREEDRLLDAACEGESVTVRHGDRDGVTGDGVTASVTRDGVTGRDGDARDALTPHPTSSQEEKSEAPPHTPLQADSAELPKAPSEPPPPKVPELKRGPPQRPQARPDSLTGRPLEIFSALVALSHLWSGLRPSHLAHAALSIDAKLKTKEMHAPKPATAADVSSWLSLAEAFVVGADELDPKFDTGPKRLARFEERLEWITRRWASEPLPKARQAPRGEPVAYDAAADAARILAAPSPIPAGPRTTVPLSQASLDLKRKLFG